MNVWPNICWLVIFVSKIFRICQRNRREEKTRQQSYRTFQSIQSYIFEAGMRHIRFQQSDTYCILYVCVMSIEHKLTKRCFCRSINERKIYKNNGKIGQDSRENLYNHVEIGRKYIGVVSSYFQLKINVIWRQNRWCEMKNGHLCPPHFSWKI